MSAQPKPKIQPGKKKTRMKKRSNTEEVFAVWHFNEFGAFTEWAWAPRGGCCHRDHDSLAEAMPWGWWDPLTSHQKKKQITARLLNQLVFATSLASLSVVSQLHSEAVVVSDWLMARVLLSTQHFSFYCLLCWWQWVKWAITSQMDNLPLLAPPHQSLIFIQKPERSF